MTKTYLYIGAGVVVVLAIASFFFFRSSSTPALNTQSGSGFGVGADRQVTASPTTQSGTNEPVTGQVVNSSPTAKVFEINAGPVAGATLVEQGTPTTTVARFVMQDSGHVFDLPLDTPGAVARAVSNTTIPGIANVLWDKAGQGALLQYLDGSTVKTLNIAFPPATTTLGVQEPVTIKFFPDGIASIAVAPSGNSVAYLMQTSSGSNGYVANPDGTGVKNLFSLPLSQMLISWPAQGDLLAQSPSAAGVPGVVFSIDAKTGTTNPILYADGVSANADPSFATVIYQTTETGSRSTYARDVKTGLSSPLSFDPLPEQCIWSAIASSTMYCAAPLTYVAPNFLDLWHMGAASAPDSIFVFNIANGATTLIATPGSSDGGDASDIASMSLSPDGRYLIFVKRGDRSLWGVRLTQ